MTFDNYCEKLGQSILLRTSDGWRSPIFQAIILMINGKLFYIGGVKHDLTKLAKDACLDTQRRKYHIKNAQKIVCGDTPLVIVASLEEIKE